VECHRVSSTC